ncbi:MAG: GerMN domain-containing protein [Acidimicrobiales bacterium]
MTRHRPAAPTGARAGVRGRRRAAARVAVLASMALLLAACGIGAEASPKVLGKEDVPFGLLDQSPPTTTVAPPSQYVIVYFEGPQRLVPARRPVSGSLTLESSLRALGRGTTTTEAGAGLLSPVSTAAPLGLTRIDGSTAVVSVGGTFTSLSGPEQIAAVAQLVYTATSFPEVAAIEVRINGQAVAVPRGNGKLTRGPLGRADFASLAPL